MSGGAMPPDEDDRDGFAAEYALGTLDTAAVRRAEALINEDAAFRAAVEAWERRLAPLARLVPSQPPPPELWSRIAAATAAPPAPPVAATADAAEPQGHLGPDAAIARRKLAFWRAATAGSLTLAAAVAAFAVLGGPQGPRGGGGRAVAVLAPPGGGPVFVAEAVAEDGGVRLRPEGGEAATAQVAPGKDLELWVLPAGATRPESLGVLPASGRVIAARLPPGARLLVSLEPRGGSPTGQPTGPVVSAGRWPASTVAD